MTPPALIGPQRQLVEQQLGDGHWQEAVKTCTAILRHNPEDCAAQYCALIGQTMLFVDQLNHYVLPRYRRAGKAGLGDLVHLWQMQKQLARATQAADATTERRCEMTVPRVPLLIGEAADPIVQGEVRGVWSKRTAHTLGAILYAFRYAYGNVLGHPRVPPPPPGESVPGLPDLLARMGRHLLAQDHLLVQQPADPSVPRGGWFDRDHNGVPSPDDELLIDIFRPGSNERVFDFSRAGFVQSQSLPRGVLTSTASLPPARCGYQRWHIDTILSGKQVGGTDGMSFSPDGSRLVLPIMVNRHYQVHMMRADGKEAVCLTCSSPHTNDGVRWQPGGTRCCSSRTAIIRTPKAAPTEGQGRSSTSCAAMARGRSA